MGSLQNREVLVFLMNGASGLCMMPELLSSLMPGIRPSLEWLGYGRHDTPVRRTLKRARALGLAAVWDEVGSSSLSADELRWLARGLVAGGHDEDGLRLRKCVGRLVADDSPSNR